MHVCALVKSSVIILCCILYYTGRECFPDIAECESERTKMMGIIASDLNGGFCFGLVTIINNYSTNI